MDVDAAAAGEVQQPPDSPVETLSEIGSKKHRMQTGEENDVFMSRYNLLEQVGSGASGTVWTCSLAADQGVGAKDDPVPGKIYAAKIIDLRPFKLRERFSMQRLMREVDIMQRLRHPNIIRLVEALDTPEQLVLVLEYAPGVELFDAILAKTKFSEDEARPVFVQVARALQYMHSKQIVHRDVKPENVMIIDRPSEDGLYPEAKLLDFGLSKAIDADTGGSVARTFVGTPSYLAPEVEDKKGGRGKPYGTPVDCWSLGAMLYVMLVARFPEFQVQGVRKHVRMVGPLWDNVSAQAMELIRNLMAFDAGARLTVDQVLRHPWLGDLAVKDPPPSPLQEPTLPTGMGKMPPLPEALSFSVPPAVMAAGAAASGAFSSSGQQPTQQHGGGVGGVWGGRPPVVTEQQTPPATSTKKSFEFTPSGPTIRELGADESPLSSLDHGLGERILYQAQNTTTTTINENKTSSSGDNMQMVNMHNAVGVGLAGTPTEGNVPLLQLQDRITQCIETAVTTYTDYPEGAASLRRSAVLCRESLRDSVTLLRKIEKTAAQVISLFPDLTLAVEEGEPDLAHDFFSTVKSWVQEMYTAVNVVQAQNSANALEVGEAMKQHAEMGAQHEELERQRQEQQRQRQQRQKQEKSNFSGNVGGTAYVAKGSRSVQHQASKGDPVGTETVAGAGAAEAEEKGDKLIAVDPETFEVVRQIQELRKRLGKQTTTGDPAASDPTIPPGSSDTDEISTANAVASDGSHATSSANTVDGRDATALASDGTAAASASDATPADALSDEKLINLFLLMAGRNPNWPDGGGAGGSGSSDSSGGGGNGQPTSARQGGGGSEHGQDPDVEAVSGLAAQMSIDGGIDAPDASDEQRFAAGPSADGSSNGWGGETQLARVGQPQDQMKTDMYAEVRRALQMLHEVDSVLEQLAMFWANSEVIFDVLLRKGDLVEKFVAFANKPRLLQRFRERLADYKRFWEGVQNVCNKYVCGQQKCGEPRSPSATPAPPAGVSTGGTGGGGGGGRSDFDGSYSASSHRTDSNHSTGSQGERYGEGPGAGQAAAANREHGLAGVGGWATMAASMDAGDGDGGGLR